MSREVSPDVAGVAEAIAMLFHPHVEVVLHDLATGRIAQLWNPISGRRAGEESLIEQEFRDAAGGSGVIGPYQQIDPRGHRITSVSVRVADGGYLLCINFDRSPVDGMIAVLQSLAAPRVQQPAALFAGDWRARINEVVADWCASRNLVARDLSKDSRRDVIQHLDDEGLFETRNAAEHIAKVLGVSRATVYNLRQERSS